MFVQQHPDGINSGRFKLKLSQYLEVTVLRCNSAICTVPGTVHVVHTTLPIYIPKKSHNVYSYRVRRISYSRLLTVSCAVCYKFIPAVHDIVWQCADELGRGTSYRHYRHLRGKKAEGKADGEG